MEYKPFYAKIRDISDKVYWEWKNNTNTFSIYKPAWNQKVGIFLEFLHGLTTDDLMDLQNEIKNCQDKTRGCGTLVRKGDIWTGKNVPLAGGPLVKKEPAWYFHDCLIKLLIQKKILIVIKYSDTNAEDKHKVYISKTEPVEVKLNLST